MTTTTADYLEPSPRMRELQLMELLEGQPQTSQSSLASLVGLTPARVNAYIRMLKEREYITTEQLSQGMAYRLTPQGRRCLAYHQVSYRAELVRLTQATRSRFRQFFGELRKQGVFRVALYGAGETGEVVMDALTGTEVVTVVCVIDDDPVKRGRLCRGAPIRHRSELRGLAPDAVVITSITQDEAIRARLAKLAEPSLRIVSILE